MLVLESINSALGCGPRPTPRSSPTASPETAHYPAAPDQTSIKECVELALRDAAAEPGQVDLTSAHSIGMLANDVTETAVIRGVYADQPPPEVSVKSMLGHTMGAASLLRNGWALTVLVGAVEEFSHTRSVIERPSGNDERLGEGCVMLSMETYAGRRRPGGRASARRAGRSPDRTVDRRHWGRVASVPGGACAGEDGTAGASGLALVSAVDRAGAVACALLRVTDVVG
ncbi:hypothetical protein [Kutzneria buriramensis]|uniref:hypothetical protein n=1 Tax=Kutzneria buriramensis TaxID=1045776 RepID=UPI0014771835|nr:hypothetical protein [Kutzneria buriramensis]